MNHNTLTTLAVNTLHNFMPAAQPGCLEPAAAIMLAVTQTVYAVIDEIRIIAASRLLCEPDDPRLDQAIASLAASGLITIETLPTIHNTAEHVIRTADHMVESVIY